MKKTLVFVLATVAVMTISTAAWAGPPGGQANGTGKLHDGGTLGFVAQGDLHGEIEYHSLDGTLNVHCQGLRRYVGKLTKKGYAEAEFGSDGCTDPAGNTYRVWVDALDRGEGANAPQDKVTLRVYDANRILLIEERGPIHNGNVQVHL